jgi:hypothetical protein
LPIFPGTIDLEKADRLRSSKILSDIFSDTINFLKSFLAEEVLHEREQGSVNKPGEVRLPSLGSLLFVESFE